VTVEVMRCDASEAAQPSLEGAPVQLFTFWMWKPS